MKAAFRARFVSKIRKASSVCWEWCGRCRECHRQSMVLQNAKRRKHAAY